MVSGAGNVSPHPHVDVKEQIRALETGKRALEVEEKSAPSSAREVKSPIEFIAATDPRYTGKNGVRSSNPNDHCRKCDIFMHTPDTVVGDDGIRRWNCDWAAEMYEGAGICHYCQREEDELARAQAAVEAAPSNKGGGASEVDVAPPQQTRPSASVAQSRTSDEAAVDAERFLPVRQEIPPIDRHPMRGRDLHGEHAARVRERSSSADPGSRFAAPRTDRGRARCRRWCE